MLGGADKPVIGGGGVASEPGSKPCALAQTKTAVASGSSTSKAPELLALVD